MNIKVDIEWGLVGAIIGLMIDNFSTKKTIPFECSEIESFLSTDEIYPVGK